MGSGGITALPPSLSCSVRWKRSALSALLGIFSHHINIYLLLCWSWHRQEEEGDGARSPRGCRCSGKLRQGWFVWREEGLDWRKATGIIPDGCLLLEEILLVYSLKISTFPAAICSVTSVYPHLFTNFTLTVVMWVFTDIGENKGKEKSSQHYSLVLLFVSKWPNVHCKPSQILRWFINSVLAAAVRCAFKHWSCSRWLLELWLHLCMFINVVLKVLTARFTDVLQINCKFEQIKSQPDYVCRKVLMWCM